MAAPDTKFHQLNGVSKQQRLGPAMKFCVGRELIHDTKAVRKIENRGLSKLPSIEQPGLLGFVKTISRHSKRRRD
jgi:hypothetical protein